VGDDAANQHACVQAHVSRPAHGIAEEVEHRDDDRAAERDIA
jgi:division protein CdvB (Snf7/Vps24/ESCRT-III family)